MSRNERPGFSLTLEVDPFRGERREIRLDDPQLVVAGFTGRDPTIVARHIEELVAIGMAPPEVVPGYIPLPNWLLCLDAARVEVGSATTSGEVEPVLIRMPDGEQFVGVGSDQTDRQVERDSLSLSKLVCPKVLSRTIWCYADVEPRWDRLRVRSFVGDSAEPYQDAALAAIRPPMEVLEGVDAQWPPDGRPLVLFLGTVPLSDGSFAFDRRFTGELRDEATDRALRCTYEVATTETMPPRDIT
jgi:4-hydroxyphenylacetate 3-monooxygenase